MNAKGSNILLKMYSTSRSGASMMLLAPFGFIYNYMMSTDQMYLFYYEK